MPPATESSPLPSPFARLQRFARSREPHQRCELCGADIAADHSHLLEFQSRQLLCTCQPCAILFSGDHDTRFRRVPNRATLLADLPLTDELWDSLHIPINLAFFYLTGSDRKAVAMYPSPAGATESLLPIESWQQLAEASDALRKMQPDVEALLINRMGTQREAFLVSIDQCYQLVGIIRTHWRGLSGGTEVWRKIQSFFHALRQRASVVGGASHD